MGRDQEPWYFQAHEMWCCLQQGTGINGYVKLPEEHPWRELPMRTIEEIASVHGGVTYFSPDTDWIGFDTAHAGDLWVRGEIERFGGEWGQIQDVIFSQFADESMFPVTFWSWEKVKTETEHLAYQVADAYPAQVVIWDWRAS